MHGYDDKETDSLRIETSAARTGVCVLPMRNIMPLFENDGEDLQQSFLSSKKFPRDPRRVQS